MSEIGVDIKEKVLHILEDIGDAVDKSKNILKNNYDRILGEVGKSKSKSKDKDPPFKIPRKNTQKDDEDDRVPTGGLAEFQLLDLRPSNTPNNKKDEKPQQRDNQDKVVIVRWHDENERARDAVDKKNANEPSKSESSKYKYNLKVLIPQDNSYSKYMSSFNSPINQMNNIMAVGNAASYELKKLSNKIYNGDNAPKSIVDSATSRITYDKFGKTTIEFKLSPIDAALKGLRADATIVGGDGTTINYNHKKNTITINSASLEHGNNKLPSKVNSNDRQNDVYEKGKLENSLPEKIIAPQSIKWIERAVEKATELQTGAFYELSPGIIIRVKEAPSIISLKWGEVTVPHAAVAEVEEHYPNDLHNNLKDKQAAGAKLEYDPNKKPSAPQDAGGDSQRDSQNNKEEKTSKSQGATNKTIRIEDQTVPKTGVRSDTPVQPSEVSTAKSGVKGKELVVGDNVSGSQTIKKTNAPEAVAQGATSRSPQNKDQTVQRSIAGSDKSVQQNGEPTTRGVKDPVSLEINSKNKNSNRVQNQTKANAQGPSDAGAFKNIPQNRSVQSANNKADNNTVSNKNLNSTVQQSQDVPTTNMAKSTQSRLGGKIQDTVGNKNGNDIQIPSINIKTKQTFPENSLALGTQKTDVKIVSPDQIIAQSSKLNANKLKALEPQELQTKKYTAPSFALNLDNLKSYKVASNSAFVFSRNDENNADISRSTQRQAKATFTRSNLEYGTQRVIGQVDTRNFNEGKVVNIGVDGKISVDSKPYSKNIQLNTVVSEAFHAEKNSENTRFISTQTKTKPELNIEKIGQSSEIIKGKAVNNGVRAENSIENISLANIKTSAKSQILLNLQAKANISNIDLAALPVQKNTYSEKAARVIEGMTHKIAGNSTHDESTVLSLQMRKPKANMQENTPSWDVHLKETSKRTLSDPIGTRRTEQKNKFISAAGTIEKRSEAITKAIASASSPLTNRVTMNANAPQTLFLDKNGQVNNAVLTQIVAQKAKEHQAVMSIVEKDLNKKRKVSKSKTEDQDEDSVEATHTFEAPEPTKEMDRHDEDGHAVVYKTIASITSVMHISAQEGASQTKIIQKFGVVGAANVGTSDDMWQNLTTQMSITSNGIRQVRGSSTGDIRELTGDIQNSAPRFELKGLANAAPRFTFSGNMHAAPAFILQERSRHLVS